ncbi:MAG: DUF4167 domain-containing protein [Boseongicola sp.]
MHGQNTPRWGTAGQTRARPDQMLDKNHMRSSKSRARSKSNRNRSVGNVVNRVFDSSGPEGKVRGTPQQIIDKYNQLARDAQLSNDRVAAENFQQHAEHYLRLLAEAQREQLERQQQQQQQQQNQQRRQEEQRGQDGSAEVANDQQSQKSEGVTQPTAPVVEQAVEDQSGLVETPEENAQRKRRPRRKDVEVVQAEPEAQSKNVAEETAPPDAAE